MGALNLDQYRKDNPREEKPQEPWLVHNGIEYFIEPQKGGNVLAAVEMFMDGKDITSMSTYLKQIMGEDCYEALKADPELTAEEFQMIAEAAQRAAFGDLGNS